MNKNNELVNLLLESRIATFQEIKGCSEYEIKELEMKVKHHFPEDYRVFLRTAGHGIGLLFSGTDIFLEGLEELTQEANELLKNNNEAFTLPEDAFVFSMHQGYEFNYFRFSEGMDPPIYQYIEGEGEPKLVWSNFNSFLMEEIGNTLRRVKEI